MKGLENMVMLIMMIYDEFSDQIKEKKQKRKTEYIDVILHYMWVEYDLF